MKWPDKYIAHEPVVPTWQHMLCNWVILNLHCTRQAMCMNRCGFTGHLQHLRRNRILLVPLHLEESSTAISLLLVPKGQKIPCLDLWSSQTVDCSQRTVPKDYSLMFSISSYQWHYHIQSLTLASFTQANCVKMHIFGCGPSNSLHCCMFPIESVL